MTWRVGRRDQNCPGLDTAAPSLQVVGVRLDDRPRIPAASAARIAVLVALTTAGVALSSGCRNACQRLCVRMRDYAVEDCGYTVDDSELDACIDEFEKNDTNAVCREWGDAATVRNEWSCEDLAEFWDAGT